MSHKDILANIAEYSFKGTFTESISSMKPLYSTFLGSFKESKKRRLFIQTAIPGALIVSITCLLLLTDTYYVLFKRSTVGKMQINYHLTIRPVLYKFWWYRKWQKLPDEKKYPGLYAERVRKVEKAVTEYIEKHYQDKFFNFKLIAVLSKRAAPGKKILSIEKIPLYPLKNMTLDGSDFYFKLHQGREIPENITFTSGEIYREAGHYSTKIFQSATSYREYFSIPPLSKNDKATEINTYYSTTPRNRINFDFTFINKKTGKEIKDMKIRVWFTSKYLDYEDVLKDEEILKRMTNGWYYYFIISHDDYQTPGKIKLWVGRDESVAKIKMKLEPKKVKK